MGESVAKGVNDGLNQVTESTFSGGANTLFNAVTSAMNTAFGVAGTGFAGWGEASAGTFQPLGKAVCKAIADGISTNNENTEAVKNAITGIANAAFEAAVTEMSNGITGSTDSINAAVDAACEAANTAAEEILSAAAGQSIGEEYANGISAGIKARSSALNTQVTNTGNEVLRAIRRIVNASAGQTIGSTLGSGLATGISSRSGSVSSAGAGLGRSAISGLQSAVGSNGSSFWAIGEAIASGVARGIDNNSYRISQAAQTAARDAYNAARRVLDIRSPSHVMEEVGEQFDQGFARGISRGMAGVVDAATALSRSAASGIQTTRSQAERIDYDRLGQATAKALKTAGVGTAALIVGKRVLSETIEPEMSQAMRARSGQSVTGRASRMVIA